MDQTEPLGKTEVYTSRKWVTLRLSLDYQRSVKNLENSQNLAMQGLGECIGWTTYWPFLGP